MRFPADLCLTCLILSITDLNPGLCCTLRQEANDLLTTAAAVAAARAKAIGEAAGTSAPEPDIAVALTAVCQVATNALEVCV